MRPIFATAHLTQCHLPGASSIRWLPVAGALLLNSCTLVATVGENFNDSPDTGEKPNESAESDTPTSSPPETNSMGTTPNDDDDDSDDESTTVSSSSEASSTTTTDDSQSSSLSQTQTQTLFCDPPPPSECLGDGGVNNLGIGCVNGYDSGGSGYDYYGPENAAMTATALAVGGYLPRLGDEMVILSNGTVHNIFDTADELLLSNRCIPARVEDAFSDVLACPNEAKLGYDFAIDDDYLDIKLNRVDADGVLDCIKAPWLVEQGDCSNSLHRLVDDRECPPYAGDGAGTCPDPFFKDFVELQLRIEVPQDVSSLSFDFAFLSAEYPYNAKRTPARYVDAFVAWLDSEIWTGNVAFDSKRQPITVDSELFLHHGSSAAEKGPIVGTAYEDHGGTPWLTTTFAVKPRSSILLRLWITDLGYDALDSAVLIDNFRWGCESGPPTTIVR